MPVYVGMATITVYRDVIIYYNHNYDFKGTAHICIVVATLGLDILTVVRDNF